MSRLFFVCALLMCALSTLLCAQEEPALSSYFQYAPEELKVLQEAPSERTMDVYELRKWDALAMRAIEERKINFYDSTRLFTYLYVAQSEAAFLSQNLIGELKGSLDPVSFQVLSLFLPNFTKPALFTEDPYSQALAQLIVKRLEERVKSEESQTNAFIVPQALEKDFSAGLGVAKWIPWIAKPSADYWPPAPPPASDPIWKEQVAAIKAAQTPMTEEKKEAVYRWAGLAYPWSDDWRTLTNQFLICHEASVKKMIQVRSTLMLGLYDCVAAYTTCKYHYLVIRPQAFDPTVHYEISVPKHPSYPSGHATESTVAAHILSFFYPTETQFWQQLAQQCRTSRIWAGIHYPLDNEGGKTCGNQVAHKVLSSLFLQKQ